MNMIHNSREIKEIKENSILLKSNKFPFGSKRYFSSIEGPLSKREKEFIVVKKFKAMTERGKFNDNSSNSFVISEFSHTINHKNKIIKRKEEGITEESKKEKLKNQLNSKSVLSQSLKKGGIKEGKAKFNRKKTPNVQLVKNRSFTATPIPLFIVMEVKKSDRLLTIAKSPPLHTKARALRRLNKSKNQL